MHKTISVFLFIFLFLPVLVLSQTIVGRSTLYTQSIEVGVYWDEACTNLVETIDWWVLEPGGFTDVVVYVRNEGSEAVTVYLETDNWNPTEAETFLHLTWDYNEQPLDLYEVVQVTLTLSVDSDIHDIYDFSFDVIIGASGTTSTTIESPDCNLDGTKLDGVCYEECGASINCSGVGPSEANTCCFSCYYVDIKADGIVDIYDAILVAIHFGSAEVDDPETPGEDETVNWDEIADIKADGVVDIYDAILIGMGFGTVCEEEEIVEPLGFISNPIFVIIIVLVILISILGVLKLFAKKI